MNEMVDAPGHQKEIEGLVLEQDSITQVGAWGAERGAGNEVIKVI